MPFFYYCIELAEGGSLYDLLHKKHHKPSPEQTQQWATEIAEGSVAEVLCTVQRSSAIMHNTNKLHY